MRYLLSTFLRDVKLLSLSQDYYISNFQVSNIILNNRLNITGDRGST